MPVIDLTPDNKIETAANFPRLKLDVGERARILCIEKQPTFAYVHELRAPKIVNGKAEMVSRERKDKTTFLDYAMDFIGRPLCLGDLGVLQDKGVDAANCPLCARAQECDEVGPPRRRFASNVIKYATKPDGNLRLPVQCELVVWTYTDQIFNKLVDIVNEWGSLREHDLLLGPCTNKDFQKFEIGVAKVAAWQTDEQIKQLVVETYSNNRITDLESCCGRKVERRWMDNDIESIAARWRIARGQPVPADGTEGADARTLTEGLGDLLGAGPAGAPSVAPSVVPDEVPAAPALGATGGLDFTDLLGEPTAPPAAAQQPVPAAAAQPANPVDFDALLDSLK